MDVSLCNAHYLHYPLKRFLKSQENLGRKQIALYGKVPHLLIDHYGYGAAERLGVDLEDQGFCVEALIPAGYGYSLFAEPGTDYAIASEEYYKNCIKACRFLHTDLLCIQPFNGLLSQGSNVLMANAVFMLEKILETAGNEQVRIALGTSLSSDAAALHNAAELETVIRTLGHSSLGVFLDIHVVCMEGEKPEEWFETFQDKIYCVNLADGRYTGYRAWGEGVYPLKAYADLLREKDYRGTCICFLPCNKDNPEETDMKNYQAIRKAWGDCL